MDELLGEFLTETFESMEMLDNDLVSLEQNPNNEELLGNIFRLVHTIKGTCGFLGLPKLEKVAHHGENVLGKIRNGHLAVTPDVITVILEAIDVIKSILDYIKEHGTEPDKEFSDIIIKLEIAENGGASEESSHEVAITEFEQKEVEVAEKKEEKIEIANIPEHVKQEIVDAGLKAAEQKPTKQVSNQSIRVNVDVLNDLMQMVSELVLTRNQLIQVARARENNEFIVPLQRLSHITSELQEGVMKTRMQPIGNAWNQFPRLIRDLSHELGKKIDLKMYGEDTELDRQLLEVIKDPLTHMVRNSADHGIEMPVDRIAAKKPEHGTITFKAYHEGGYIIIEISDDGRGINIDRVKNKVIENGLATESELGNLSESQILQYIFKPGFSTAEKITSVSGRGVGMDVVKTNIERIGGTVELQSRFGFGSSFLIKIPLTLAIMPVLIVETIGQKFAIPQVNITEMVSANPGSNNIIEEINGSPVLRLREKLLPLIRLDETLQLEISKRNINTNFIVVCDVGGYHFGIIVDKVFDTEEIVVKPVSPLLKNIDIYSGNTILGDGSVIMILDPNSLSKKSGSEGLSGEMLDNKSQNDDVATARFVLFKAGDGAIKAVPLELVSRLEEVDIDRIEFSSGKKVVQYRGDLMVLQQVSNDYKIAEAGFQQVIVFADNHKIMGIAVEEILDIVENSVDIKLSSNQPGFMGSIVINEKTCDIIDVNYYFSQIFNEFEVRDIPHLEHKLPRIMMIDDSPFFRKVIPSILINAGFDVEAIPSAEKALKMLEIDSNFDLIITDINMPGMNGDELIAILNQDSKLSHIPILILTSHNSEEAVKYDQLKVAGFISKTNHKELAKLVRENLLVSA